MKKWKSESDSIDKKELNNLLKTMFLNVDIHELYCLNNCMSKKLMYEKKTDTFYSKTGELHDDECKKLQEKHSYSLVECDSNLCKTYLIKKNIIPTYTKNDLKQKNKIIYKFGELIFSDSDD